MISSATHVAQWWKYKTQRQQDVQPVEKQWLESGQPQALSLMARAFIQQEDKKWKRKLVTSGTLLVVRLVLVLVLISVDILLTLI